jgi:hypothetical protein
MRKILRVVSRMPILKEYRSGQVEGFTELPVVAARRLVTHEGRLIGGLGGFQEETKPGCKTPAERNVKL